MNDYKSVRMQVLEQSLINFLLNKRDALDKMGVGRRKVLAIQLKINSDNPKHLTFTVQMGMFVAEFNLLNGIKERGACFGLERYIRDWAERDSVKSEMLDLTNINAVGMNNESRGSNVRNTIR